MGRPDRGNESWDHERLTATRLAALNGRLTSQETGRHKALSTSTGELRSMPQRPPNMPHVDENPEKRRVPRPDYQPQQRRRLNPRFILLGVTAAIIAMFGCIIFGFLVLSSLIGAVGQSLGPAATATNFLGSLSKQNYKDAYQYLGPGVTIRLNQDDFAKQTGLVDNQYGAITNYTEVDNSSTVQNNTESFTFTITRAKMSKPYRLTITLQQDQNDNNWKIVDYGQTLGPPQA